MSPELQQQEFPYYLKIETATGLSLDLRIAFMTRRQIEDFLQFDFKRLVQEAGLQGARVHVQQAPTVDYERALDEIAVCFRSATTSPKAEPLLRAAEMEVAACNAKHADAHNGDGLRRVLRTFDSRRPGAGIPAATLRT